MAGKIVKVFRAEIKQAAAPYKGGAYIEMPFDVNEVFGKKKLRVLASFDGFEYRGTVTRMGTPTYILIIRKDIRAQIGKTHGDVIDVIIQEDTEERKVEIPEKVNALLNENSKAKAAFEKLSYTNKKEYINSIKEAKRESTRERRMQKMIAELSS